MWTSRSRNTNIAPIISHFPQHGKRHSKPWTHLPWLFHNCINTTTNCKTNLGLTGNVASNMICICYKGGAYEFLWAFQWGGHSRHVPTRKRCEHHDFYQQFISTYPTLKFIWAATSRDFPRAAGTVSKRKLRGWRGYNAQYLCLQPHKNKCSPKTRSSPTKYGDLTSRLFPLTGGLSLLT
jgi:hypothetical protein